MCFITDKQSVFVFCAKVIMLLKPSQSEVALQFGHERKSVMVLLVTCVFNVLHSGGVGFIRYAVSPQNDSFYHQGEAEQTS